MFIISCEIVIIFPILNQEEWVQEKFTNLLKVIQLLRDRARMGTQVFNSLFSVPLATLPGSTRISGCLLLSDGLDQLIEFLLSKQYDLRVSFYLAWKWLLPKGLLYDQHLGKLITFKYFTLLYELSPVQHLLWLSDSVHYYHLVVVVVVQSLSRDDPLRPH